MELFAGKLVCLDNRLCAHGLVDLNIWLVEGHAYLRRGIPSPACALMSRSHRDPLAPSRCCLRLRSTARIVSLLSCWGGRLAPLLLLDEDCSGKPSPVGLGMCACCGSQSGPSRDGSSTDQLTLPRSCLGMTRPAASLDSSDGLSNQSVVTWRPSDPRSYRSLHPRATSYGAVVAATPATLDRIPPSGDPLYCLDKAHAHGSHHGSHHGLKDMLVHQGDQ